MIDFNQVRRMTMDEAGIKTATEAFMINDPYYPRPLDQTAAGQKLWAVFKEAYLSTSKLLQKYQEAEDKAVEWNGLPERFVEAVVEAQQDLLQRKADATLRAASDTYA